jgi:outer membrane protein assembly factor BamA
LHRKLIHSLLILTCLFCTCYSFSQRSYETTIAFKESILNNKKIGFKDSITASKYVQKKIIQLQKRGYLLASTDSSSCDSSRAFYQIYKGERFQSAKILITKGDISFLRKKARLTEKYLTNFPFTPNEITQLKIGIHQSLENNGFPFAKVKLDSIGFENTTLKANLVIEKGPEIRWTKINIRGDQRISQKLIGSYIQIKEGDIFNQEVLNLISSRLSLLPFVQEIKPAEILFTPWGAELYLYLQTKKVSLANGVIGLQPKTNGKGYMLTGELALKLVNELKRAETFALNWKSIQYQTQSLNVMLNTPNLFRTRFGFDGNFNLYKRDTSFLDLKFQVGVQYALNNGSYARFYYRNENSSILKGGKNNVTLVNLSNTKTNFYGLQLTKQTLDYLPNPRKGYQLLIDGAIGQRKTKPQDSLTFVKSLTYKLHLNYQHFITLYKRNVLRLGLVANYLGAPKYYSNEVFRFGGQIIQRGFNEEQLYATAFGTASIEYRFLVDKNSYAFAFYDQSYYENRTSTYFQDYPLGFGAGFTFGTKIGSFSISYALGKQKNSPVSFKDGKIHFGYIAYF